MKNRLHSNLIETLETRIAPAAVILGLDTLKSGTGFKFAGSSAYGDAGWSLSAAGDVNGDGLGDFIVGAYGINTSYVIFGTTAGFPDGIAAAGLDGTTGFQIPGPFIGATFGASVGGGGDLNKDGFDDLVISASGGNSAYVIFGHANPFSASLAASTLNGTTGFIIHGSSTGDQFGHSVSFIGDVNKDGYSDLLVAAIYSHAQTGSAYVIFGAKNFASSLSVNSLNGANGFELIGENVGDGFARAIGAAGDVNKDGYDDVLVGAYSNGGMGAATGAAYLVYGKAAGFPATISASALNGNNGFKITGETDKDLFGASVSGAGDVNHDGIGDILVGANGVAKHTGAAYVIYGQSTPRASVVASATLGSGGLKINGEALQDDFGFSVASLGDVDKDGIEDFIVGAPGARGPHDFSTAGGAAYFIKGAVSHPATLAAASLTSATGAKIVPHADGSASGGGLGQAVGSAGDLNGDGTPDILLGEPFFNNATGNAYAIYGHARFPESTHAGPLPKVATFTDSDGDIVTVKVSKGFLDGTRLTFGSGGADEPKLKKLDLSDPIFAHAVVSITVKKAAGGDGLVNVGLIDAHNVDLASVSIAGNLAAITVGNDLLATPGLKRLKVHSLGKISAADFTAVHSEIKGGLGALAVAQDLVGAEIVAVGDGAKLGPLTIKGSVRSLGAARVLLSSPGKIDSLVVSHDLAGLAAAPILIYAGGATTPTTAAAALALGKVTIGGSVIRANFLIGDSHPDARIGNVTVGKDWTASVLAASTNPGKDGFYASNDDTATAPGSPAIASRIAKIIIGGHVFGTAESGDFSGFTAQEIGSLKIAGKTAALSDKLALVSDVGVRLLG